MLRPFHYFKTLRPTKPFFGLNDFIELNHESWKALIRSDALQSAQNELSILFPDLKFDPENPKYCDIDIPDVISRRESDALKIEDLKYPPPNPQITKNYSTDLDSIPLAKEDFWDGYHRKQKQDWFLNQNQALEFIKRHTKIADNERKDKITVLDLGAGTSTLILRIIFMMKSEKCHDEISTHIND